MILPIFEDSSIMKTFGRARHVMLTRSCFSPIFCHLDWHLTGALIHFAFDCALREQQSGD